MSKTLDLLVTITCDDEDDFSRATDSIAAVGTIHYRWWQDIPNDDQPQGTGGPAAASNGSERGFDSPPGVEEKDELPTPAPGYLRPRRPPLA